MGKRTSILLATPTIPATRLTSCSALRLWRKLRTNPANVTTPSFTAVAISVASMSGSDLNSSFTSRLISGSDRIAVSPHHSGDGSQAVVRRAGGDGMRSEHRRPDNRQYWWNGFAAKKAFAQVGESATAVNMTHRLGTSILCHRLLPKI